MVCRHGRPSVRIVLAPEDPTLIIDRFTEEPHLCLTALEERLDHLENVGSRKPLW